MQTLAQLDKNDTSKYLKNLLLGVGTIICFGRASTAEMKEISDLSGTEKIEVVQKSKSSSSIVEENPNSTTSERITPDQKPIVEASDVRNRDFTEVTILTLHNHRVLAAQVGKTHFIKKTDWEKKPRHQINWEKISKEIPLTQEDKSYIEQLQEKLDAMLEEPEEDFRVTLLEEDPNELPPTFYPEEDESGASVFSQKATESHLPDFDDAPKSVTTNNAQSPQNGVQSVSRVNTEDECAENFEDDIEDEIDE